MLKQCNAVQDAIQCNTKLMECKMEQGKDRMCKTNAYAGQGKLEH